MATVVALCGCTVFSGSRVDYRSGGAQTNPLEVPPDLTQISRSGRYQSEGGSISASATAQGALDAKGGLQVAPLAVGDFKVERDGDQRWLSVPKTPEQVWPQVIAFWTDLGFTIEKKSPEAGTMETNWAENRAKLPQDIIRKTLGGVLDSVYSTGELDQYRTRIERTPTGSEIFITQKAMEEVYTNPQRDNTRWQPKAPDKDMEAEMLSRLLVKLGASETAARTAVDNATPVTAKAPDRARVIDDNGAAAFEVDDNLDRAWRRVGIALDHSGFTVEDRNRAAGVYYVRYVDPATAGQPDSGNFFTRLFSSSDSSNAALKYQVALKAQGAKTRVSILDSKGEPANADAAKHIVKLLVEELK